MDDLFSLDSVRDFILSKGGRVKNHDLVTHFKSFLNDPTRKVKNRQTFKTYVNTLATVKLDESGEKVLVLKKKYRDGGSVPTADASRNDVHHDFSTPMPKPPPRKVHKGAARWEEGDEEEAGAASAPPRRGSKDNSLMDVTALYEAAAAGSSEDTTIQISGLPESESHTDPDTLDISGVPETESSTDPSEYLQLTGIPTSESSTDPGTHVELPDMHETSSSTDPVEAVPAEPKRVEIQITDSLPSTAGSETSSERDSPFVSETVSLASEASSIKGESSLASETSSMRETSLDSQADAMPPPPAPSSTMSPEEEPKIPNATPMSVKDRAKHLNKMASETDIHSSKAHKQERGERRGGDDDSSSVSSVPISMDAAEREWLVTSAAADYHPMAKILLQNPHLAKRKNFMNGFTPLHWAAKHGKPEVIKLLCGTHYVDVNARSHGYTALHLAAMHGHEEIIELLVHGYGADPNIRDYSGKKAKQYLPTYASTRAHQLLQPRRLSAAPQGGGNFRRVGSYSAKIQKSGFFGLGNRASVAMRDSWASSNASEGSDGMMSPSPAASPRASPLPSPLPSPVFGRKGSR